MKIIIVTGMLLASVSALAAPKKNRAPSSEKFEIDCNEIRQTISVLSQNLQSINASAMKILEHSGKDTADIDVKVINESIRATAETIDTLSAKADKSCR